MTAIRKLPDSISVLGETYSIKVDVMEDYGDTDGLTKTFRISNELDSYRQWSTLVHEWVHGVMSVTGVANVISEDVQEVLAQSLEHGIMQLIRQHGKTLTKISEEGK